MRRYDSNLENAVLAFFLIDLIEVGVGGRPLPGRGGRRRENSLANRAKPSSLRARFPSPRAHAARVRF